MAMAMAHDTGDDSRIRRMRLSGMQVDVLNEVFESEPQPSMETRAALADQLGMEIKQISSWFQNRRQKLKSTSPPPASSTFFLPPTTTPSASASVSPNTSTPTPSIHHHPSTHTLQSTFQLPPPPAVPTYPVTHTGHRININPKTKEEPTEHVSVSMFRPSHSMSPSPTSDAGVRSITTSTTTYAPSQLAQRTPRKTSRSARLASSPIPTIGISHPHSHSHSHSHSTHSPPTTTTTTTSRARMSSDQRAILQDFWMRTTQPTMDERAIIADRAGMSIAKVTNWFRNLRQSERKKGMALERERERARGGKGEVIHLDEEGEVEGSVSDSNSDEEGDELVTPWNSPDTKYEHSFRGISPATSNAGHHHQHHHHHHQHPHQHDQHQHITGPKVEDALLLLYFTQNCGLEDKNMSTNMKGRSLFV